MGTTPVFARFAIQADPSCEMASLTPYAVAGSHAPRQRIGDDDCPGGTLSPSSPSPSTP